MTTRRLEAFRDGVIAIIVTITVSELKVPHGGGLKDLGPLVPVFLSYVLSFLFVGIYWNNDHHMLHTCTAVTGAMLWANLHLLFWLSLFPFTTGWMGENHFTAVPTALYGLVLLMAAIAYYLLSASDHSRTRAGFRLEKGDRSRLEGQAIAGAVYRGDRYYTGFLVDRPGGSSDCCADMDDSRSTYRETSCPLRQRSNEWISPMNLPATSVQINAYRQHQQVGKVKSRNLQSLVA
jgi:uncharacterized membrane protein